MEWVNERRGVIIQTEGERIQKRVRYMEKELSECSNSSVTKPVQMNHGFSSGRATRANSPRQSGA